MKTVRETVTNFMKKEKRSIEEVTSNPLFPGGIGGSTPNTEVRLYAVIDVLQRIPEEAYRSLSERWCEFVWFIPIEATGAMVTAFPCTLPPTKDYAAMAKVLYLPPDMESLDSLLSVAAVAHELAHIFLNHDLFNNNATYAKQEREAWRTTKAWGFEKENRAHAKLYKELSRRKSLALSKAQREISTEAAQKSPRENQTRIRSSPAQRAHGGADD